ncbi:MAG: ABC transporter substrate-binding protein [Candidatus Hodarchaeota archaeon]
MKKMKKNPMMALRLLVIACTLVLVVSPMVSTIDAQPAGYPKLPWVGLRIIADESVRFLSMQQGEVHTQRYESSPTLIRSVQQDPNLELIISPGVWLCYLEFNLKRVGDKVVRQAIAYANDKEDMINTAKMGWAQLEEGIISIPWHPEFVSPKLLPEGYELTVGEQVIATGTGELNYPYNITKANQLLDDAGYIDTDGNGIRNIPPEKQHLFPTGVTVENPEGTGYRKELRFEVRSLRWFPSSHKPTEILVEEVPNIGIEFELHGEESSVMYPAIFEHKDFDIFTLATSQSPEFSTMIGLGYSGEYYPWGQNDCGFNNSRYDELWLIANTKPMGSEEQIQAIFEMQEMLQEEAVWISWYTSDDVHFLWKDFVDWVPMAGGPFTDMNIWTLINMYNEMNPNQGFMMAMGGDVMQCNPMRTTDLRTQYFEVMVYDSLLVFDPSLKVIPWLAEEYTYSADGLDWTFKIRDDAYWHDGKKLTAEDVAWNFEFCYDEKVARYWSWIQFIDRETITVEGNTVKFSLTEPYTWFEVWLPDLMIMAPHTYPEGQDWNTWDDPNPIGSGPFKFDSRIEMQETKLVRNDNWWYMRPETTTPETTTPVIPELDGSFLLAPVVVLGFSTLCLLSKRKTK